MKVLKNIIISLLKFTLLSLVFMLIISFSFKNFLSEAFVANIVKEELTEQISDSIDVDEDKVRKILESEEANNFINDYVNKTLEGVVDSSVLDDVNLNEDIMDFIRKNENILEKEFGISVEDVEKLIESELYQDIENSYKQSLREVNTSISKQQKDFIKLYNILLSNNFKLVIIILIVLVLFLISLLEKSFYKWIKYLGVSVIVSGIFITIMAIIAKVVIGTIIEEMVYNINFRVDYMLICSLITFIIGILIYIIYKIINKICVK